MSGDEHALVVFESIHEVMRADALLKGATVWHDLIPTPRQISADCGMALTVRLAELAQVRELLASTGSADHPARFYREAGNGYAEIEP